MSKLMAVLVAGLFCVSVAQAQDKKPAEKAAAPAAEKKMTAQQSKMGDCNKEAKEKKLAGDERKKFMSGCLKGGAGDAAPQAAAGKPTDQNQKMGYCNKEAGAKQLKGDERKKFMSECLKG
ncbi:MAG: PsiF family protein [Proteobacteria bacterium]|nr:PsiF family protein [Pseudomonadota bacterium]